MKDHKLIVSRHVLFGEDKFPTLSLKVLPLSKSFVSSHVVHPNIFSSPPMVPIPLPVVFKHSQTTIPCVTQAHTSNSYDLVLPTSFSTSSSTFGVQTTSELLTPCISTAAGDLELHPLITTSQVSELQKILISSHNTHLTQTI